MVPHSYLMRHPRTLYSLGKTSMKVIYSNILYRISFMIGGTNDLELTGATQNGGKTTITFRRRKITGLFKIPYVTSYSRLSDDSRDLAVGDATYLLYAFGDAPGNEFTYMKHSFVCT